MPPIIEAGRDEDATLEMTSASAEFVAADLLRVYTISFASDNISEPGAVCRILSALPGVADVGSRINECGEMFFVVLVVKWELSALALTAEYPGVVIELVAEKSAGGVHIRLVDGSQIPLEGLPVGPFRKASGRPTAAGERLVELAGGAVHLDDREGEPFYRIDK